MALARWQATITNAAGDVVPLANVQVRREINGLPLAQLYADADGTVPLGNPFTADADGYAFFYAVGGTTLRVRAFKDGFQRIFYDVRNGNAGTFDADQFGIGSNTDRQVATLADRDDYDAEDEGFSVLVSDIGDGRAGIYTRDTAVAGVWVGPAIITGPAGVGRGLDFDVVVADLAERADYDAEDEGFAVLVSDSGDGRAAVYIKLSNVSADWSDPNYLVGDRVVLTSFTAEFPHSGEEVYRHVFTEGQVNFEAGLGDSAASADDASTGTAVFSIEKNGTEIGTVTFTSSLTGTFALAGGATFVKNDVLKIIAPAPQDATLFNVSISLAGVRVL